MTGQLILYFYFLVSMFWWTNETINIWSHIFGWMLFLGLTLYDLFLLNIHASFTDKFIVGVLLMCFQVCFFCISYHSCYTSKCPPTKVMSWRTFVLFAGLHDFVSSLSHVFLQVRGGLFVLFNVRSTRH